MPFATVFSAQATLAKTHIIAVEADVSRGLHAISVVGLPDKAVEEAWERISAAIKNSGLTAPKSKNHKVVISLAPADIKKSGPAFDVPMALAYLLAAEEIRFDSAKRLFLGELSLDGRARPVPGVIALAREMAGRGFNELYVPVENAAEAALITNVDVYPFSTLSELIGHIDESKERQKKISRFTTRTVSGTAAREESSIGRIKGNTEAKRMLEIAAAGSHHCALWGPPGTGKTMLARAFPELLPPLSAEEHLEVLSIYSIAGLPPPPKDRPPFRAPHHTASYGAIIGGGSPPKAGELTLAHRGVLFMDEFPEFNRQVLESLREPLEEGVARISRIGGTLALPANIILIVALNPCPCGYFGSSRKECVCAAMDRIRYRRRLSGPIIDRIDLWTAVQEVNYEELTGVHQQSQKQVSETAAMTEKILRARAIQKKRLSEHATTSIEPGARDTLIALSRASSLSGRSHQRIIKIAQTITDLEGKSVIDKNAILEAFQYRPMMIQE